MSYPKRAVSSCTCKHTFQVSKIWKSGVPWDVIGFVIQIRIYFEGNVIRKLTSSCKIHGVLYDLWSTCERNNCVIILKLLNNKLPIRRFVVNSVVSGLLKVEYYPTFRNWHSTQWKGLRCGNPIYRFSLTKIRIFLSSESQWYPPLVIMSVIGIRIIYEEKASLGWKN